MPSNRVDQTIYLGQFSSPETFNSAALYRPGELGKRFELTGKGYQIVQLDSGATASAGAGVVAAGQIAFWKDKSKYLVTNDKVNAIGGPGLTTSASERAGIFGSAITAGYYCMIQQRGRVSVATDGGGDFALGGWVIAKQSVAGAIGDYAAGTAAAPIDPIGIVAGVEASSLTPCDLSGDLVEVP